MARSSRQWSLTSLLAAIYQSSGGTSERVTTDIDVSLFDSFRILQSFSSPTSGPKIRTVVEGSTDQDNWAVIYSSDDSLGTETKSHMVENVPSWIRVRMTLIAGTAIVCDWVTAEAKD